MSTLDDIRAAIATWDNPVHPEDARWLTTGICLDGKDSRLHSTKQLREWCQHLLRAVDELNARLIARREACDAYEKDLMEKHRNPTTTP